MHLVIVGGSDAGISAALRARELDATTEVTVVVADAYPNYSICGIPYFISGDVHPWQSLAHRTHAELEATGMALNLNTRATAIDVANQQLSLLTSDGGESRLSYDELIVGTGALPSTSGIRGAESLTPEDGLHVIHSMDDTFRLESFLVDRHPSTAIIVGAGYVGLEMAEALVARGIKVTQLQRGPEVLSTLDPELGAIIHDELVGHGVDVLTGTLVDGVESSIAGLKVTGSRGGSAFERTADLVLVVVGVRPNTQLLVDAGATLGAGAAIVVDRGMRTALPHVFAAGDGVITHHRLLGETYLPLGTTAHKQGRIAGENALGGSAQFAGSLGTQVVKVFDLVAARTGLRDHEAVRAGLTPATNATAPDDHKRYYPGSSPINIRITGDIETGLLLGAQLVGTKSTETAKRVDTYATAIHHRMTVEAMSDLDLSYTPPLGSPWDAVQVASQAWSRSRTVAGGSA